MAAPARSRERLLAAGSALFSERGFAATTTRDIAERAGVDAALIVRHFGSKVGLYLACLQTDDENPADLLQSERMLGILARIDTGGPGPVFLAALHAHTDEAVQAATTASLQSRIIDPLIDFFTESGADRPRLRAEFVAAAFAGIALARTSGAFAELAATPPADIVALVQATFAGPGKSNRKPPAKR